MQQVGPSASLFSAYKNPYIDLIHLQLFTGGKEFWLKMLVALSLVKLIRYLVGIKRRKNHRATKENLHF